MGTLNAKSNRNHRSADMDMYDPSGFVYKVPEDAEVGFDYPDDLGHGQLLNVRMSYQEQPWRYVDFAFNHYLAEHHELNRTGEEIDVARIDCCENSIHRHQFFRSQREQEKHFYHQFSEQTCTEDCIELINGMYDKCYREMVEGYRQHYTDWRDK